MRYKGTLWYAPNMTREQIEQISEKFNRMFKKPLILDVVERPGLIGGFVAHINGKMYDASMRGKVNEFSKYIST